MATGDKLFLADKATLDTVNTNIGTMADTASSTTTANNSATGTALKRLYYLVSRLGNTTDAAGEVSPSLFGRINFMINRLNSIYLSANRIGQASDTNSSYATGTVMGKLNRAMAQNDASVLGTTVEVPHSFSAPLSLSGKYDESVIIDKFVAQYSGLHTVSVTLNITSPATSPLVQIDCWSWESITFQNATSSTERFHSGMDFLMQYPLGRSLPHHFSTTMGEDIDTSGAQTVSFDIYCKAGAPYIIAMDCYAERPSEAITADVSAITITAGQSA